MRRAEGATLNPIELTGVEAGATETSLVGRASLAAIGPRALRLPTDWNFPCQTALRTSAKIGRPRQLTQA